MEISDEDKLIINGQMFFSIRSYIRQKKPSSEIITMIESVLNEGADINARDGNDNNNTIMHIATQKEQKEIVLYLLEKKALMLNNKLGKTPLEIALQTNTIIGKEIADILTNQSAARGHISETNLNKEETVHQKSQPNNNTITSTHDQQITYEKRSGTSGVSGQFYETKLLSLVLHRALHDKEIEEFYLAANIKGIGDFDDVCFRYGNEVCFMQTKHRENTDTARLTVDKVRSTTGKLGLGMYFDSFLKIRNNFSPHSEDPMFKGKFEDINSYFVLYTPLKEDFERKLTGNNPMCSKMHDIIHTGENKKNTDIFQFRYENCDIDFLTKFIKRENLKSLAKTFLEFTLSDNKLQMMTNDLIKEYHPALAQKVILITRVEETPKAKKKSKTQDAPNTTSFPNNPTFIKMGKFRDDFFDSEDENLLILKHTFYNEIVYTHSTKTKLSKEEIVQKIQQISDNPCAQTISELIGSPLKFDDKNDKLSLNIDKLQIKKYKQDEIQQIMFALQKIQVTATMVKDAVHIAGQKILKGLTFQLPQYFGNLDLTTNVETVEVKKKKRLDFLVGKFKSLIEHYSKINRYRRPKIINVNHDVIGPIIELTQLIDSNGGIGGTVGNLLVFDSQDGLLKFNTQGVLENNAKYILESLKSEITDNLSDYKFKVVIHGFPRCVFDVSQNDKDLAAEFLRKLWFYSNQAQEESVEIIIKKEIKIHYNADKHRNQFLFHVHSDAIFLRFHDEIVKWWKRQKDALYLTKNTIIYEKAKKDIVDNPLLTVLNVMFIRKMKIFDVQFNENVIEHLDLNELADKNQNITLNIVSNAVVLSAIKIMQFNNNKNNCTFVNLDYVHILPRNDYATMIEEIRAMKEMTLVIISETSLDQGLTNTLLDILTAFTEQFHNLKKQIIIITSDQLLRPQILKNYEYSTIKDDVNFIDLTPKSQKLFLEKYKLIYQGQELPLNTIIDENSKDLINAKILWSLLNREKIQVGQTLTTEKYKEIQDCYISRNLKRDDEEYNVNTLDGLDDQIVLVSSKPGMGKTTLLTHLSLGTKKVNPKPWIVKITMSIHDKKIEKLKNINIPEVMHFLCKSALKDTNDIDKNIFTEVDNETIGLISDKAENVSFELKLFIHCYNSGHIIFLFDGFDRIYPQHTKEVMELFTMLQKANKRMWITCDSYVIKILEKKFGASYTLEPFSKLQQKSFLERFWATNLKLHKLNHEQCNNILLFLDYVNRGFNSKSNLAMNDNVRHAVALLSLPLHLIYLSLLEYFKNDTNSLSIPYLRETIKKKWRLNSFTALDDYLGINKEDKSSELIRTPMHMYIAANYFVFQITDKFDLHIDTKVIRDKASVYINAITLYERFLKVNMKHICEVQNKTSIDNEQDKLRDHFFENHKKLALYTICKESDIPKFLTESEIVEVKKTIKMIESGEIKTPSIDCVVDGIPQFYNWIFAEYFAVDFLSELLKKMKNNQLCSVNFESLWDFIVNIVLVIGPKGLRNAFEYKLKYDPELAEVASDDNSKKIVFNLLLKPNQTRDTTVVDEDNALNVAFNEGLVNTTNFLLKSIQNNINETNFEKVKTLIKCSAGILSVLDPSRSILSEETLTYMQNLDAETITDIFSSLIGIPGIRDILKPIFNDPQRIKSNILQITRNNANVALLLDNLPYYLLSSTSDSEYK